MKHRNKKNIRQINWIPLLIIIMVGLLTGWGYIKPGLPPTDDGILMVIRASGFHQSFIDGHLPVRWIQRLNENYGYPVTNFLYPLPFYLAEIFQLIGYSSLQAIKAVFVLALITGGVGMFLFIRQHSSARTSLLASLAFMLAPYQLTDLYQRGSVGEVVALSIIPWLWYRFIVWKQTKQLLNLFIVSLLWSLLITAHNSLALLFSGVFGLCLVIDAVETKQRSSFGHILLVILGTSLLSMWFWLPALFDLQFTRANQIQISQVSDHFLSLTQVLSQIGLLGLLAFIGVFVIKNKSAKVYYWLGIALGAVLIQLPQASWAWEHLRLDRLVQFPFRFSALVALAVPILWSRILDFLESKKFIWGQIIFAILLALISGLTWWRIHQIYNQQFDPGFFETNFDSTTNQREFTPLQVKTDPSTFATSFYEINQPETMYQIVEAKAKTQEKYLQVELKDTIDLVFNTHYFPGWHVLVDDELVEPEIDEQGRPHIELTVPDRRNRTRTVQMIWKETPVRQASNLISLFSWAILASYTVFVVTNKKVRLSLAVISIGSIGLSLGLSVLSQKDQLKLSFDPIQMEQKYLRSQWVDPASTEPLGDHGLYAWAGWAYVHGEDPTLINAEMPPLGKYLIGIGLWLTQRTSVVGLFFSATFLISLWLLSAQVVQDKLLAFIPLALISLETIFRTSIAVTMLDNIQLTFLCLSFYSLIKAETQPKWFVAAGLLLGGVISSKFYISGVLVVISIILFYLTSKRWTQLKWFLTSLPLVGLVHMASYWRYFLNGHSVRDYLGVQKWIFEFYRAGSPEVPWGSYWKLVFLNQWRVWWGPSFGIYYTLKTKEWNLLWPIHAMSVLASLIYYGRLLVRTWLGKSRKQFIPIHFILLAWLATYAAFLTNIGGWPHYMLMFLPFSSIVLIRMIQDNEALLMRVWNKLKVIWVRKK